MKEICDNAVVPKATHNTDVICPPTNYLCLKQLHISHIFPPFLQSFTLFVVLGKNNSGETEGTSFHFYYFLLDFCYFFVFFHSSYSHP